MGRFITIFSCFAGSREQLLLKLHVLSIKQIHKALHISVQDCDNNGAFPVYAINFKEMGYVTYKENLKLCILKILNLSCLVIYKLIFYQTGLANISGQITHFIDILDCQTHKNSYTVKILHHHS